ncbi:MAG: sulfate adenylyltransferase, partial [Chloroflexi bacterium UTCFX4]
MNQQYIGEIAPHGGVLINRIVTGAEREKIIARAESAKSAHHYRTLNSVNLSDLEMIAVGAMSPLTGFMGKADYENVVNNMRLANGLPWSIPITLPVSRELADNYAIGSDIALVESDGHLVGLLELAEKFDYDKVHEAKNVYRTDEEKHPGVA